MTVSLKAFKSRTYCLSQFTFGLGITNVQPSLYLPHVGGLKSLDEFHNLSSTKLLPLKNNIKVKSNSQNKGSCPKCDLGSMITYFVIKKAFNL
ncbi:hypothetical protein BpHYR1_026620 [Brachionus plicatilis]|uniref:Uncharacterized protein n=1 Tax=Brachionus plicatilis TaxID=10195 RepID=A0A3M7RJG7_BRAPC|nr:hypothetical protein BpHYR1_026620 [Brachionus plicatilis]